MDQNNLQAVPFDYVVTSPLLAANATGSATLLFMADSEFEIHYFLGISSADTLSQPTNNNFSVLITDGATGRAFASQRVPQALFSGNAFNSSPELRAPRFLPQTNLVFDFLNLTGGNNTVTIVLKGTKFLL